MRRKNVYVDRLGAGDYYAVMGKGPDGGPVVTELGVVEENGYRPVFGKPSVMGTRGFSGAAYRMEF